MRAPRYIRIMAEDPAEKAAMQNLATMIGGMNPQGGILHLQDRIGAGERYLQLKEAKSARDRAERELDAQARAQEEHSRAQEREAQLEAQKVLLDAQHRSRELDVNSHHRGRELDIEEEKLQIAKAEVIVRAIEAASRNPEVLELLGIAKEMSRRLLGAPMGIPAIESLEDKPSE